MKRFLFCAVLILFGGRLKAQETTAQITSHTNGQTVTDPNITITWKGCSNSAQTSYTTIVDTVAISTTQSSNPTPCPDFLIRKNYSASKTLTRNGNHDIYVQVCDGVHPCGEDSLHIVYAGPEVTVTPKNIDAPVVAHGGQASYPFKIKNTGTQTGLANLSFSCSSQISPCSLSRTTTSGPVSLAAGDSLVDTLSYEGTTVGTGTASVTATYTNFTGISDSGYVRVSVQEVPTAIITSPSNNDTFTNANITITFKGCSNATVTSGAASLNDSSLGTPTPISGPACPGIDHSQNYSIPAQLRAGVDTISVSACDANILCSSPPTMITVTYTPPSVSVTPDAGTASSIEQNTGGSYTFNVSNTGGSTATAKFSVSCTVQLSCPVAPDSVILAPSASSNVTVSYSGSNQGDGSVTLTATYKEFPTVSDNGSVSVTVTPPSTDSVTVVPVQTPKTVAAPDATISFNVRYFSQNTPTSTFSFATIATGSVTSCSAPSPVTLSAGAVATTVDVSCSISTTGATGSVKLTATRTSSTAISNFGTTNITIDPIYRISIVPSSGSASVNTGATSTYNVQIKNTSLNAINPITVTLPSPACSGVTLGSCAVPGNSAQIGQDELTSSIAFSYTALAAGSETVTFTPSGTASDGIAQATSGTLAVTVSGSGGSGSLSVVAAGKNAGTTIDKSGCLTIPAGQNAAYECGDLRVVHPLPATVTMDRSRGPALIYNSRHANPGALLAADVTYTASTPDSLQATVIMPGQANIVKKFPWSSACATACRIVVPVSTSQATNLYPVTLQVSAMSGTTAVATGSATDTVVIVNRASSPYGSGWWLDGLESLVTVSGTQMLWIGGDGSARLYTKTANDTVYTVTPAYDRPDSLTRNTTAQTWHRQLGDGAYVEFDNAGKHIKTRSALGWVTTFAYTNELLNTITLPVPANSSEVRSYRFLYSGSMLDSVQSPVAALSRTTFIRHAGSRVDSISDPGDLRTRFAYDASNRIRSRINRLGDETTFQYDDAGALKQSSLIMARTNGAGSAITTNFKAAETRSAYAAGDSPLLPAKVFTQLDGPRTDVGDTTNVIVNRWGAPDSVTNAVGQRTLITRAGAFPALATKVIASNGLETRAFYNARGLTDSTMVIDPYNN